MTYYKRELMEDKGQYKFDKSDELEPVDEEIYLQGKLEDWKAKKAILMDELLEANAKITYYEKAIKSYNKAFKKT